MAADRKAVVIEIEHHKKLSKIAKDVGMDMCNVLHSLIRLSEGFDIDWSKEKIRYTNGRVTPHEIRARCKPFKDLPAQKIADKTGLSLVQVETFVTYDVFRRALDEINTDYDKYQKARTGMARKNAISRLIENAGIGKRAATRYLGIVQGFTEPTQREKQVLREYS